jgi:hypothetical protein
MTATVSFADYPPCPECARPLKLNGDTKNAHCGNDACSVASIPAGDLPLDRGQAAPGWPRPVVDRRPVPWVVPIIGPEVAWTALNAARLRQAQQLWLCQLCGESLASEPTAWIAVYTGLPLAGGALHRRCSALARNACPVLHDEAECIVHTEVRREDQAHEWSAAIKRLEAYEEQHGQLPDVLPLTPAASRPTSTA